jgi:hypothetical protein
MGSCLDDDGGGGTSLTNINQASLLMEMQCIFFKAKM